VALCVACVLAACWQWTAFIYGSTVKFRYNILWTLLALWVLQVALTFLVFACLPLFENMVDGLDMNSGRRFLLNLVYGLDFLLLATCAWMWWRSWVRYRRVQITSTLNP